METRTGIKTNVCNIGGECFSLPVGIDNRDFSAQNSYRKAPPPSIATNNSFPSVVKVTISGNDPT
jgi:hypothetical protein